MASTATAKVADFLAAAVRAAGSGSATGAGEASDAELVM
jgi:hypothetical protein